jgi:methyltransferase-like protein 6
MVSASPSEFWREKYEAEAARNWDLFYKRHKTLFFKDRHWTLREFQVLATTAVDRETIIFEVGCGVGNLLLPLLKELPRMYAYACDISSRAIQLLQVSYEDLSNRIMIFGRIKYSP